MTFQIVWPSSKVEIGPFVNRISEMNSGGGPEKGHVNGVLTYVLLYDTYIFGP